MGDRRNVGENSCNSGDGTDQTGPILVVYDDDDDDERKDDSAKLSSDGIYEGESKSKAKIHLTTLIEVSVSNFTYRFST